MTKKNPTYLDYQGSTPLAKEALKKMLPYFEEGHVNPHASSLEAKTVMRAINEAREQVASLIHCETDEVFFTSGATESNNTALRGIILAQPPSLKRDTILISSIEHSSVRETAEALANQYSLQLKVVPVDKNGRLNVKRYEELLDEKVLLVSVMAVNNEIGTIQDIEQISTLAKHFGAYIHCDAAQMPLAAEIDVQRMGVDLLSLSAHKMYGPKGIGALFISFDLWKQLPPLIYGGGQQDGVRAGTLPTPLCVGFGAAAQILKAQGKRIRLYTKDMRSAFLERLRCNNVTFKINGSMRQRHPGNLNICFPGVEADHLLMVLGEKMTASQGSACNSGFIQPSRVLIAIGLSEQEALSSIRFGFGLDNTLEEVIEAADNTTEAIRRMLEFGEISTHHS